MNNHRAFKDGFYSQLSRFGKALASPARLEFLDLLAQSERSVESLAGEVGLSLANASQHLLALREAGLVTARKQGLHVFYRLAGTEVSALVQALQALAEARSAEMDRLVREHFATRAGAEPVAMAELLALAASGDVTVLDTRPRSEYEAGHIAGAVSMPVEELRRQLEDMPAGQSYVAYCRGKYCFYADEAVELLQASGRKARRLEAGFPEWQAAGMAVEGP